MFMVSEQKYLVLIWAGYPKWLFSQWLPFVLNSRWDSYLAYDLFRVVLSHTLPYLIHVWWNYCLQQQKQQPFVLDNDIICEILNFFLRKGSYVKEQIDFTMNNYFTRLWVFREYVPIFINSFSYIFIIKWIHLFIYGAKAIPPWAWIPKVLKITVIIILWKVFSGSPSNKL